MPVPALAVEGLESRRLFAETLSVAVDAGNVHQTVDAIGGAVNSGYQPSEYRSAAFFNQVFGDLGITAARSALDPGWELANDNNDPNTYDWSKFDDSAIATTMEFFAQAKARGVNTFLLSVWTPPAWAKTNKAATNGGQLRPADRAEFAEYVAAAVIRAKTKWGIDITQVSIANEPFFTEPYPSAMWTPTQYRETFKAVAAKFKAEGLTAQLVGPEEVNSLYRTQKYVSTLAADPVANADFSIIGNHYLKDGDMTKLAQQAASLGKKVWYTEVGNGNADIAGAIGLARGVDSAFTYGNASAWLNWQVSSTSSFEGLMKNGVPTPKYYALKHFAHFVRPGAQRIDAAYTPTDNTRFTAFKDPNTGALTFVLSNKGTEDATFNLSLANANIPAAFEQYRTSATENCARIEDVAGAANMTVTLPAGSIVTLYAGPALSVPQPNTASAKVTPTAWVDAWNSDSLRRAAFGGYLADVNTLIANGADVNAAFADNGWTPLFTAAASPYGKADQIVTALLNAGADVKHTDVEGLTALHVAAMNEVAAFGTNDTIVTKRINYLIAAGADVNARDIYGRTPLMYAAMLPKIGGDLVTPDLGPIQALLDAGADRTLQDVSGRTALDWANAEGATAAAALLAAGQPTVGSIEAHAFKDANKNGTQDPGEAGLAGVTVYLDLDASGSFTPGETTLTTDTNGVATFVNQAAGPYAVRAIAPATYTPAEAAVTANVSAGATTTAYLAFVPQPSSPVPPGTATLSGYVVNDVNKDGKWTSGERGIAGRTVYIDSNTNGKLDANELTAVTASNGKYVFANIGAGTYAIRQVLPDGWTQTRPAAAAAITTTAISNVTKAGLDFCTVQGGVTPPPPPGTASIKAYVINDKNKNGKWDSGEAGLTGRTVWIDADNDGKLDAGETTATTGVNGVFLFSNLAAGTYRIRQVLPAGWKQTSPAAGAPLTITLTAGQAKSGNSLLTATA